ncbi:Putative prolin-rich signal peptide protein [Oxalobacteraceae bacterium IMCC9480]|nr:Putative prolin-rich signal peptide protein [Oxalobacteraceae bacterium IMCC9480]
MTAFPLRHLVATTVLLCASLSASAQHAAPKRQFTLPPSADLTYAIRARQSGLSLSGEAQVKWRTTPGKYSVSTETRSPLVGKIVEASSDGSIDAFGLAPASFTEKRWRKDPTTTTFDRAGKVISFAPAAATFPLLGGEQDRNSAIWQLIAVARANAAAFKVDSSWEFFVAGPRDAEPWIFKVGQGRVARHRAGRTAQRACDARTTTGFKRAAARHLACAGDGMVSGEVALLGIGWRLHRAVAGKNRQGGQLGRSTNRILRQVNDGWRKVSRID